MFDRIAHAAGFTATEAKALTFLLLILICGLLYKHLFLTEHPVLQKFDYTLQDSLFRSYTGEYVLKNDSDVKNNVVDYKQEVLDFNKQNFTVKKRIDLLKENSINLNKAHLDDLMKLPGIGEATAQNIISYRELNGAFRNLEELMNVKRIGEKRFSQIKKYLFIE